MAGGERYQEDYPGAEHERSFRDYQDQPASQQDYRQFNDSRGPYDDQMRVC